jgi:hypothetical protein
VGQPSFGAQRLPMVKRSSPFMAKGSLSETEPSGGSSRTPRRFRTKNLAGFPKKEANAPRSGRLQAAASSLVNGTASGANGCGEVAADAAAQACMSSAE